MKRPIPLLTALCILIALVGGQIVSLAQDSGPPFIIIQGDPDSTADPPKVRTYVSVIDKSDAKSISGLTDENFQVEEVKTDVGTLQVSYESVGLAIVVVVDRGGIAAPGDSRIKEATGLVNELVNRLSVTTTADDDDMIALIPVMGEGESPIEECDPARDLSYNPVDTVRVTNCLSPMEGRPVSGGTPLYDGLDEALALLTKNTDATIRNALSRRRKIIVLFSDGIDPNYSDEAREGDIIREAKEAGISIYAIGMAHRNGQLGHENNLVRLSNQTNGFYQLRNNDETHQQVLGLFDNLMTQRDQYLVIHSTSLPKGSYTLDITVDTPVGSAEANVNFSSILETPQIALTSPANDSDYTVPYSKTIDGFEHATIPLNVQITPSDGQSRDPAQVSYFANSVLIGTSTAAPDFAFTWNVSDIFTPTEETQEQKYTLIATANDAYLGERMESDPITIQVTWEAKEYTIQEQGLTWLTDYWWLLLILAVMALGMLILLIILVRTRGELARKVVARTTGVLKGVTQRLGAMPKKAPGKLVVIQGANMGKEFRLSAQVVKVGRDPQFCDFALYDEYASNPHFSIQLDQTQFFITDEGSTNGTRLNSTPMPPRQRMLLQPDAIIEVGQTRLQFKRLGGTTRQLGAQPGAAPPFGAPAATPQPGQGPLAHPATQPAPPPGPGQRGGPTKIVH